MGSNGTYNHAAENPSQGSPAIASCVHGTIKVHIGSQTFYCNAKALKKHTRLFATNLTDDITEVQLAPEYITAGAFRALYGWLSGEKVPCATAMELVQIPLAAECLGIPSLRNFWLYQHNALMHKINMKINNAQR